MKTLLEKHIDLIKSRIDDYEKNGEKSGVSESSYNIYVMYYSWFKELKEYREEFAESFF